MRLIKLLACCGALFGAVAVHAQENNLKVKWDFASDYDANRNKALTLTLLNTGGKAIDLSGYELWFNSMYPIQERPDAAVDIHNRNGNLYAIDFAKNTVIKERDSLVITYDSPYPITHTSLTPNGFYLQGKANPEDVIDLGHPEVALLDISTAEQNQVLNRLFAKNEQIAGQVDAQLILPTPAKMDIGRGFLTLPETVKYSIAPEFGNMMKHLETLAGQLSQYQFIEAPQGDAFIQWRHDSSLSQEEYTLNIDGKGIRIGASTDAGAFYALQSLKSLLHAAQLRGQGKVALLFMAVQDKPRYGYRGFMMDIARNFKDVAVIKKYIDLMAQYKLNKFHLHLIDDEGWRLEIPSLPELTEIGSVRSADFNDGNSIQPAYGSGPEATAGAYLSKAQFQEILTYAADRFITVIPEVETPGHGRAAIKAMETRYNRLMKAGKKQEAEEFLLYEAADQSVYSSAQYWDDNVMNPALPSVYRFLDVVVEDIKKMYNEVGLELKLISLGGDEVPAGSWEKSPAIKALMEKEGMESVYEVWPYYVKKIQQICASKGMDLAGWEEFGMINKGSGMVVNNELSHLNMHLDVWNNVIGGGQEDLAYRLANAGYKTVFTSCANFYLDMVWDKDFREPGLKWASITDLEHAFSLLPENFFANMQYTEAGSKLEKGKLASKVRLTEKGRSNLIGVKGALWAETILTADRMDYMLLPRFYALAERAWAPKRSWEDDYKFDKKAYDKTYKEFVHKVGSQELPKLASIGDGFNYRLPSVGVLQKGQTLFANAEYPGFTLVYTVNGADPGPESTALGEGEGVKVKSGDVVRFATVDSQGRVGRISTYVVD